MVNATEQIDATKSGVRVFLEWIIERPDSLISTVIRLNLMRTCSRLSLLASSFCCLFLLGCNERTARLDLGRDVDIPEEIWMSSRYSSSPSAWLHLNFYQQLDKYSGYGIVHYSYDSGKFKHTESEYFEDSLRMIRSQYGNAYQNGNLKQWSNELSRPIPWKLEFVVIFFGDHCIENMPDELGVIVPASDLFDDRIELSEITKKYKLERGRHRIDTLVYPIIETHAKADAGQQTGAQ